MPLKHGGLLPGDIEHANYDKQFPDTPWEKSLWSAGKLWYNKVKINKMEDHHEIQGFWKNRN